MRVYGPGGECVAESPVREPDALVSEPAVGRRTGEGATSTLMTDVANLAPVTLELEAVRMYSQTGSLAAVSRQLGIAIYELQKLQRTEWWQAELAALRREENAMKNAQLTRVHELALAELEDRIEHGDFVMRGRGFVRVKMSGRDLARASESIFRQRQLVRGEPTHIDVSNKRLEELAQKLGKLGAARAPAAFTIDMEAGNGDPNSAFADPGDGTETSLSYTDAPGDD